MSDYHCLDIEFQNVDFSAYYIKGKTEISKVHHAHLTSKDNEIQPWLVLSPTTRNLVL